MPQWSFPSSPTNGQQATILGKLYQYDSSKNRWVSVVSITGLKTVNGESLAGSGDIVVQPTLVSGTNIKTVNSTSLLGSGDVTIGGGSLIFLSSAAASSSATISLETTFDSTYDQYLILGTDITPATNATEMHCRLKIGGSYLSTSTYSYVMNKTEAATYSGETGTSQAKIPIAVDLRNGSSETFDFQMFVYSPATTTKKKRVSWTGIRSSGGATRFSNGVGDNTGTSALTGVQFYMLSGNIATGNFHLYGIKKS